MKRAGFKQVTPFMQNIGRVWFKL